MKTKRLLTIVLLQILALLVTACSNNGKDYYCPEILSHKTNIANFMNFNTRVQLSEYNGNLYFCNYGLYCFNRFANEICVFDSDGISVLADSINYGAPNIWSSGFCYRSDNENEDGTYLKNKSRLKVYNINIESISSVLFDKQILSYSLAVYDTDGSVYLPFGCKGDSDMLEYMHISGTTVETVPDNVLVGYQLGDRVYSYVMDNMYCFGICSTDIYGNNKEYLFEGVPLGVNSDKLRMIPCETGILIHCSKLSTYGDCILFYIDGTGNIHQLFCIEGRNSHSAVNIRGSNVYFSVIHYTGTGNFLGGYTRTKNDHVEGTYRISLDDFSVEKISNITYSGLYNFDDNYLYATNDQGSIYMLDFDGNVIRTLLDYGK